MGNPKTIQDYQQEIKELQQQAVNAANRERQLSTQEVTAKETEVSKAKAAVKAKQDEIDRLSRALREEKKTLEVQQRKLEKELRDLEAEEKEAKRLQSSLPRRIRMREEKIEELKAQGAPQPQAVASPREEGLKPTTLEDLAAVMEEEKT